MTKGERSHLFLKNSMQKSRKGRRNLRIIGIFFSPVKRSHRVCVVRGERTSYMVAHRLEIIKVHTNSTGQKNTHVRRSRSHDIPLSRLTAYIADIIVRDARNARFCATPIELRTAKITRWTYNRAFLHDGYDLSSLNVRTHASTF